MSILVGTNLLEVLTGNVTVHTEILVHVDQDGGENTEKGTETKDDKVTNTLGKRRFSSEEGVLACILGKGRDFDC